MKMLKIYDPAMCCSSGVCGPSVDQTLVEFASAVNTLKNHGVEVKRFNLAQDPLHFTENPTVVAKMHEEGVDILPMIFIGEDLVASGEYPSLGELAAQLGIKIQTGASSCCGGGSCC